MDVTKTLVDLISIDSSPQAEKTDIVDRCADILSGMGLVVTVEEGTIRASQGKGGPILSGHLDTVPLGDGWSRSHGEVADGKVFGRGAADMKGGVAVMLVSARELVRRGLAFTIYLTTDEEVGMNGAKHLASLPATKDASAILVCEPTDLYVAYAEKGVFRFRLITRGRSGHSSSPWLGKNAIMMMNDALSRLKDLYSNEPTGGLTMSVNTISGGIKDNVIPDHCEADVDARYPPSMDGSEVMRVVAERLACCDYQIEVRKDVAPFSADPFDPFNERMTRFLRTDTVILPYATEASVFGAVNPRTYAVSYTHLTLPTN